ncbi:MAG: DUF1573 domain-containing protein [Anaerolineae bacterium]|nr:DUF1573 domain-containing protein [Anaerolineae bacterium]
MRSVNNGTQTNRNLAVTVTALLLSIAILNSCGEVPAGKINILATETDFGTVPNTDLVTRIFEVRNTGEGKLDITQLSTSCSCTTATLSKDKINPGDVANLTITFDPGAHNGATGQFMRQVFIESNDPETPKAVFTFRITVVEE